VLETAKALGNPILIGHSLGGLIALKLAENQNPPAVVALSPAPPRGIFAVKSPAAILSFIRHLPRILFSRPILLGRDEAARLVMNGIPLQQQDALYARGLPQSGRLMFELTILGVPVDASKVRCPVLVVAGKDDRMTPSRIAKRIAEKYRADFREYTGHAHLLELEPGWKEIAHDIANWLERAI
jgi:pimeloyl-ACP methyl ester carboxylesterase